MSDFTFYFQTGWHHIISWDALDHILFVMVLAAPCEWKAWKKVLVLVTAFTIGHSITLALSVYDLIRLPANWVELGIAATIFFTAVLNLYKPRQQATSNKGRYSLALFFGLIHGLGFAGSIRFMLASDQQIGIPLLGFNLGLEAGQILVVVLLLLLSNLLVNRLLLPQKAWIITVSLIALIFSIKMLAERIPVIASPKSVIQVSK